MLADRIPAIQQALVEAELDGWLFVCFQLSDPISLDFLGLGDRMVTRRCYYLVPTSGQPRKLNHALEPAMLDHLPGEKTLYLRWQEHREELGRLLSGVRRLAVQYSPKNEIPGVSRLDAGHAELLREAGCELHSSAELVQRFAATWSPEQYAGHCRANDHLHRIVKAAFAMTGEALKAGRTLDEHAVQQWILAEFDKADLVAADPPIVGVNAHAADPHYMPGPSGSAPIRKGDFLLIDLFAKEKTAGSVYADITWCGVCAAAPTERQQEIWSIAVAARDAGLKLVQDRYPREIVRGYEVDDATRAVIDKAGYGKYFIHRTGHSIHTTDHGPGANMDNLETHDVRRLVPWTCFSIEPGIYFPGDFGVRTEINVVLTPERAEVTGHAPQHDLLRLLA